MSGYPTLELHPIQGRGVRNSTSFFMREKSSPWVCVPLTAKLNDISSRIVHMSTHYNASEYISVELSDWTFKLSTGIKTTIYSKNFSDH